MTRPPNGWVNCPNCARRFQLSDPAEWSQSRHVSCGQRLVLK